MTAHADAVNLARRLSSRQENDLLQTNLYGKFHPMKISQKSLIRLMPTLDASECSSCLLFMGLFVHGPDLNGLLNVYWGCHVCINGVSVSFPKSESFIIENGIDVKRTLVSFTTKWQFLPLLAPTCFHTLVGCLSVAGNHGARHVMVILSRTVAHDCLFSPNSADPTQLSLVFAL
jgi:hypothetical protein